MPPRLPSPPPTCPFERRPSEPGRSRYRGQAAGGAAADRRGRSRRRPPRPTCFRQATVSESRFSGADAEPAQLGRGRLVRASSATASRPARCAFPSRRPPRRRSIWSSTTATIRRSICAACRRVRRAAVDLLRGAVAGRSWRATAIRRRRRRRTISKRCASRSICPGSLKAAWGETRALRRAALGAAPPPAIRRGASVDGELFRIRARLPPPDARAGLAALALDAAALATAGGPPARFADVRIARRLEPAGAVPRSSAATSRLRST